MTRDKVLSYLRYEMNGWNALPRCVVGGVRGGGFEFVGLTSISV